MREKIKLIFNEYPAACCAGAPPSFDYWFTFILNPDVEPTNNRAERVLRPQVILRKIMGTLRNDKGTSTHERIMTTLTTWEQRGLDGLKMLTARLAC